MSIHDQQFLIAAVIPIGAALLIAALLRLDALRDALITGLAIVLRSSRKIGGTLHQFWLKVQHRAEGE